jgi:5-methylcytosine-specific restriction endonuclease McrA
MFKYYWNQTYYFKLKQGPAHQTPEMMTIVNSAISYYQSCTASTVPVWFNKADSFFMDEDYYPKLLNDLERLLHQDVSHRFMKIMGETQSVYSIVTKPIKRIRIKSIDAVVLKEHAPILTQLLNYKWVQLLEKFNHAPRIANKVQGSYAQSIRRQNLAKYRKILLREFDKKPIRDFYTGEVLKENDISIDHVIPWSFMYSDDLWNLVITSKAHNSKKSNHLVDYHFIESLKENKINLLHLIKEDQHSYSDELKEALDNDYIEKFYKDFKY